MTALTIPQGFTVSPAQFDQLALANDTVRLELTQEGELIIMPPTGGSAGNQNFELYIDLGNWNRRTRLGKAFDSSTIFILPNGARRSPDVAWVRLERWNSLSPQEQQGFPPITPDFVIELVSPSDLTNQRYVDLQAKMREYIENGAQLGWLIEPKQKTVEIYRPAQAVEVLKQPATLSGEAVLPRFVLNLRGFF
ncbi:MAG: Uma2 family endonuclease [Cyanophyceae cyanobacterium]